MKSLILLSEMSKVLFAMLVLLVCTMADPLQDIKAVIQQDQCGMEAMEKIKPELEKQAALLREVHLILIIEPRKYGSQN